jgi:inosine-uridine nucleoside N-ribohydrolase
VELIISTLEAASKPVTLITIGPLTNIALACALRPDMVTKIERLLMMGGSFRTPGVNNTLAEFNILADPEAAALVFSMPIRVTMFGLDVTKKRNIEPAGISTWNKPACPFLKRLHDASAAYMAYRSDREQENRPFAFFHDAMPVMFCKYPELFSIKPCTIQIDLNGEFTRGMTVVDLRTKHKVPFQHEIALDVDAERFLDILLRDIETACTSMVDTGV